MSEGSPRYADWKAPSEDGQILIWPPPSQILRDTQQNHKRLGELASVRIQGVPLNELRQRQRAWIGHTRFDQPLIATGHQAELYHPGVWVKNILINQAARKLDGAAYHFAVDTDSPKHLHVRWPGGSRPITDDSRLTVAEWSGLLESPTPQHLKHLAGTIERAAKEWSFKPIIGQFLEMMLRLSPETPDLPSALTNSIHETEWAMGLRHHSLLTSPMWYSTPYLVFLHHIIARAAAFGKAYNASLAQYRRDNGLRTNARPMPDLRGTADSWEIPFWQDDLQHATRQRAQVVWVNDRARLMLTEGESIEFDPNAEGWSAAEKLMRWLRSHNIRLTPRALTLTMFFRLVLVDQFVHGIGGGRYDQVTDRIIEGFFGVPAPMFSVTTGTLYFPAAAGKKRVNLYPLLQEYRRVRHGSYSQEKLALVQTIEQLPRRSAERRRAFFEMHSRLNQQANHPEVLAVEQRLHEARDQQVREGALFDRELFFMIQPRGRLDDMIVRYQHAFA